MIRRGREECDDGDRVNTNACTNLCLVAFCGDDIVDRPRPSGPLEACDDGNLQNDDQCLVTCERARCGDGFVNLEGEQCDDENDINEDACLNDCTVNVCW